jgi:hypothetical protein
MEWDSRERFGGKIFLKLKKLSEFAEFKNGILELEHNMQLEAPWAALRVLGHEIE